MTTLEKYKDWGCIGNKIPYNDAFWTEWTFSRFLDKGGYGSVWLIKNKVTSRLAAFKMFDKCQWIEESNKPEVLPDFVANEIRAGELLKNLALLEHSEMLLVCDNPTNFFAHLLDFVPGEDLCRWLNKKERLEPDYLLSPSKVWKLFKGCADALYSFHCCGITHGDVKLENFIYTDDHKIKLIDYGSLQESNLPCLVDTFGTYGYCAPEWLIGGQRRESGAKFSQSLDIFGLGATFLIMLTDSLPYDIDERKLETCFDLTVDFYPEDPDVESLLRDMLSLVPEERPSIVEVLARINQKVW